MESDPPRPPPPSAPSTPSIVHDYKDNELSQKMSKISPADQCSAEKVTNVKKFDDVEKKREYIKEMLANGENVMKEAKNDQTWATKEYYEKNPGSTRSLDFLKAYPQVQVAGRSQIIIPHDELMSAMEGFTNMQLAHEICINHDFRLEAYSPPENSLEERVRTQMRRAYWDLFDEALSSKKPNPSHAISVFREIKQMLLNLLLPHNRHMRTKIEEFLNDDQIHYEIKHHHLDLEKYSGFVIDTLGQLCCPMRDKQVFALKQLEKPSEVFQKILETMEHMQLDLANFLISQVRPTIITNCVEYERYKFAQFLEMECRLKADALRVTRSWILRHKLDNRCPLTIMGRAYAEVLMWNEIDWPETLTLDWSRCVALADETKRISYLGAAVHCAFNAARSIFGEDDAHVSAMERANLPFLRCYPLLELLRADLNDLIQKDDILNPAKLKNVMELMAEQAIKITSQFAKDVDDKDMSSLEKDLLRKSVVDCAREDNVIRLLLIRRMQEYITEAIAAGKMENIAFPKALACIEEPVIRISLELHRIALHNRAVFEDLYEAIINSDCLSPAFTDQTSDRLEPNMQRAIDILYQKPAKKLVLKRPAENEKLEGVPDEDTSIVETTPEIERMIDAIIAEANIQDDFDLYANVQTEHEATVLLHKLMTPDDATIKRLMTVEAESKKRVAEKKRIMREKLRLQLKVDMGMAIFKKEGLDNSELKKYCKLLKIYAKEDAAKLVAAPVTPPPSQPPPNSHVKFSPDLEGSGGPNNNTKQ